MAAGACRAEPEQEPAAAARADPRLDRHGKLQPRDHTEEEHEQPGSADRQDPGSLGILSDNSGPQFESKQEGAAIARFFEIPRPQTN